MASPPREALSGLSARPGAVRSPAPAQGAAPAPAVAARAAWGYRPITPARVLDTRPGQPTADGEFSGVGAVGPASYVDVVIGSRVGLPAAAQLEAVVVNVTGIAPSSATYLTAVPYPLAGDQSSTLNLNRGEVAANLAIVPVLPGQTKISIYNDHGWVHVAVDVVGFVRHAVVPDFYGTTPLRLLDTRVGSKTIDGAQVGGGRLAAGKTLSVDFNRAKLAQEYGRGPQPGDTAVLNVTGVWPSHFTFLTVYPGGTTRPLASSLNVPAASNVPNLVFAKIGAGGLVTVYNDLGSLDVVVDLVGYLPRGANFRPLDKPFRLTDTRAGQPTDDGVDAGSGALGVAQVHKTQVTGRAVPVIEPEANAVAINLTGVAPSAFTFLAAYPTGTVRPTVSTLNLPVGAVRPNAAVVPLGGGAINTYNEAGKTHVIVDAAARVLPSDPLVGGWITNEVGDPLVGATVSATSPYYPYTAAAPKTVTVVTNQDGFYELPVPTPGGWFICAIATGYQKRCWSTTGPADPGKPVAVWSYSAIRVDLSLPALTAIRSTVTGPDSVN